MEFMFVCPRCCYSTPFKQALLKHLAKLKACPAAKDNRSREEIINELTKKEYNEKTYDCQFCGKKFNSCSNKSRHLKVCKKKLVVDEKKATFDGNTESLIRENVELASKANESALLMEKLEKLKIENENLTQQLKIEKERVVSCCLIYRYFVVNAVVLSFYKKFDKDLTILWNMTQYVTPREAKKLVGVASTAFKQWTTS